MSGRKKIFVLGGYGNVGRAIVSTLVQNTDHIISLGGRNLGKANEFAQSLHATFPERKVATYEANPDKPETLRKAFQGQNLVIVAASIPEYADKLILHALDSDADWLDIFVQKNAYQAMQDNIELIKQKKKTFITQAGFHPGLPAIFIRLLAPFFSQCKSIRIFMAMNGSFEQSDSTKEIVMEIQNMDAKIKREGVWRKATLRDLVKEDFGSTIGKRDCYPLSMEEIIAPADSFGLEDCGVYAAGFNFVTDYFITPLIYLSGKISKGIFKNEMNRLFQWGANSFKPKDEFLKFRIEALGLQNGKVRKISFSMDAKDAVQFTADSVFACLNGYFEGKIPKGGGGFLMGQVSDPIGTLRYLEKKGASIQMKINDSGNLQFLQSIDDIQRSASNRKS